MKRKRHISNASLMAAIVTALLIGIVTQELSENTFLGAFGVTKVSAQTGGDPVPTPPRPQNPYPDDPDPDDPFPNPKCPDPEEPCPPDNDTDIGWIEYLVSFLGD